jgi:hypothetical protein
MRRMTAWRRLSVVSLLLTLASPPWLRVAEAQEPAAEALEPGAGADEPMADPGRQPAPDPALVNLGTTGVELIPYCGSGSADVFQR